MTEQELLNELKNHNYYLEFVKLYKDYMTYCGELFDEDGDEVVFTVSIKPERGFEYACLEGSRNLVKFHDKDLYLEIEEDFNE